MSDGVMWQSEDFPKLILTRPHYDRMRKRLRYIESFRDELEKAELWLHDHPERRPKKNWATFITNWMKNADRFTEERIHRNRMPYFSTRGKEMISGVVDKYRATKKKIDPNERFRCNDCKKIHHPGAPCV